ncbi:MAG: aminoacyl-histidine dipeptidase [Tissierellia bacterium]|nr:aminoacyl-histidine dipeptidase [Tissierellia bacterium]
MIRGIEQIQDPVLQNFALLTDIPRGSGNEEEISNFLKNWAQERGLEVHQDRVLNIIMKKPASPGLEGAKTMVLQGHMDMVNEVKKGFEMDFDRDPIPAEVEGDLIIAKNTTLGGDNGIAVAMIMAIFEDKSLVHPPLEALITVDEERGMTGAIHLEGQYVDGRILINLDSEDEGVLCAGCAGGQRDTVIFSKEFEGGEEEGHLLALEGLTGGHSGQDIHRGRGNANLLLARILHHLDEKLTVKLGDLHGGSKSNAIPRDAQALIFTGATEAELQIALDEIVAVLKKEYEDTDPNLKLSLTKGRGRAFSSDLQGRLMAFLLTCPNGVHTMSQKIPGLVESSNNFGVIESREDAIVLTSQVRSSVASRVEEIARKTQVLAELAGAQYEAGDGYPAWEYASVSPLRDLALEIWKEQTGEEMKVETIHAGLECGLLQDVLGTMDMISIGPDMAGVHAPGEHLSISSTKKVYKYLKKLLEQGGRL